MFLGGVIEAALNNAQSLLVASLSVITPGDDPCGTGDQSQSDYIQGKCPPYFTISLCVWHPIF